MEYHEVFTDTYCDVIRQPFGYTLYFHSNAKKPEYDEYYYKISGDIRFENIEWDSEDDGWRWFQVWSITPKGEDRLEILFDIGSADMVYGQVEITPLTKEEYCALSDDFRREFKANREKNGG